ncbi:MULTISPECIES: dCTP deaminase [Thermoactinomyces]|jgi:dCTP deaminase|uniref:dCTP deaminase n=2 Tax=Thermoactinomyces TaxID=2023 RepID=A0A8I1DEP9_THEIN|nr:MULTISPECIES: dCTP deaminase [Thermoactinomyces]KFZ40813.1 deoxycytidine triphosphate deaminase [Thermoactinomyces sp. Gus2-1]KYQ86809.1 dCTP deaminase [Thermoactinomyces sp. AS95]MBA4547785.1 dCTP deaminase [Thermoactinomyces intermedius]MBA4550656.1 dCTP deaminase [Thermoactinomyces vulgaris]MBA4596285.1 dCTP deaminase [Thermoactinomyces vulgaris]
MAIKSDKWIRKMAEQYKMIEPFIDRNVGKGEAVSYGLSSYGYDLRVADEYKIFHNALNPVIDPKAIDSDSFLDYKGDVCIIPPNSFALARSVEYFRIPENVLAICVGKSTYARCGIITNVTPLEPGWEGYVTLEISNTTPLPAKIYSNEGLCQILFLESDEDCEVSYRTKKGKYQFQSGITLPKV